MGAGTGPVIAVIGAGAIGGVVAAAAVDAGHRPTVCLRDPLPALVVEAGDDGRTLPVDLAYDVDVVGTADWVLVTTKAQDTDGARAWLERLCGPRTVVVVLQNGIDHVERVAPLAGPASVLPALVYVAAERIAPGRVLHHSGRRIIVPAGPDGRRFIELLAGGGLDIVTSDDFATEAWRKLMSNVVANPLTALTLRRLDVMGDPGIEQLGRRLLAEAVEVGRAEGAAVTAADIDAIFERYAGYATEGESGSSMYYDRLAGRPLEHRALTGALVQAARRHDIDTPVNDTILALVSALDRSRERAS